MGSVRLVQQLMSGATADLYTVATHPTNPDLFATAADNSILRVWDGKTRAMDRCMSVKFPCRSVAFSQDGSHLAVGGKFGDLTVLSTATLQPLVVMKDCVSAIDVIKFSPNNHIMVCVPTPCLFFAVRTRPNYVGRGSNGRRLSVWES